MPEPGPIQVDPSPAGAAAPDLQGPVEVTPVQRVRAVLEVMACSGIPSQFAIATVLRFVGISALDAKGNLAASFVFTLSLLDTAVIAAVAVLLLRLGGEQPRDVFVGRRAIGRETAIGLALVPVVFVLVLAMLSGLRALTPWLHNVTENPLEALLSSPGQVALFAVVGIVAGGLREEVQRAFVLHRFEQYLGGPLVGLAIVSVAFGAGHIVQGWDAMVTTGALGAFWGALYLARHSAVAPVVSHAGFNTIEILRVFMTR